VKDGAASGYLIYGANGYTGRLIARYAVERDQRPILAGRNAPAVEKVASALGLEAKVFDLGDPAAVDHGLSGIRAVLHCAGPFAQTSHPMVDACLRNGVTYLDIKGEVTVFEACAARDAEARMAGVMLMPGVGFDIVPVRLSRRASQAAAARGDTPVARDLGFDTGFAGHGGHDDREPAPRWPRAPGPAA
jgi:short subunit dehydrogenase-like uncharacterized protein